MAECYTDAAHGIAIGEGGRRAASEWMQCRGPDGSGEWTSSDRRISLAHRRLAIIDLSDAGAQPMQTTDGALVISFNGEIYNYRELRAVLEQDPDHIDARLDRARTLRRLGKLDEAIAQTRGALRRHPQPP